MKPVDRISMGKGRSAKPEVVTHGMINQEAERIADLVAYSISYYLVEQLNTVTEEYQTQLLFEQVIDLLKESL